MNDNVFEMKREVKLYRGKDGDGRAVLMFPTAELGFDIKGVAQVHFTYKLDYPIDNHEDAVYMTEALAKASKEALKDIRKRWKEARDEVIKRRAERSHKAIQNAPQQVRDNLQQTNQYLGTQIADRMKAVGINQ